MKYRIKEISWFVKADAKRREQFILQYRKRFLFFRYWKSICETHYAGYGEAFDSPKIFESYGEARDFMAKLQAIPDQSDFRRYYYPAQ